MRNPTLHKVHVLILLVDEYWERPGAVIRVKDVWRQLDRRGIDIADRTVRGILDALVDDQYLSLTPLGREKLYSINEEISAEDIRNRVVRILGIREWVMPSLLTAGSVSPDSPSEE